MDDLSKERSTDTSKERWRHRERPVLGHWMPRWIGEKGDFEESAL